MRRSERGFSTIIVALSLTAMLGVSALALDLGQGYSSRRAMQNAADTSSLAAARALLKTRNLSTGAYLDTTNTVQAAAVNTATDNGAASTQVTCSVVRRDQSVIAPCSPSTGWVLDTVLGGPAGVIVKTGVTNATAFAGVFGRKTLAVTATATALIKPLTSANGAPFLVCGIGNTTVATSSGGVDPVPLTINLLLPSGAVNPLAVGHYYGVQGSGSTIATCGTNSAFDGKSADGTVGVSVPSWQLGTNGNGNDASVYDTVAGAAPCPPGVYTNCDLVIPLADSGASGYQLHVVSFGLFHIKGNGSGNPKYIGQLLTVDTPITRGQGGSGNCLMGNACVIKLVN